MLLFTLIRLALKPIRYRQLQPCNFISDARREISFTPMTLDGSKVEMRFPLSLSSFRFSLFRT
jgi:hypothetical protein